MIHETIETLMAGLCGCRGNQKLTFLISEIRGIRRSAYQVVFISRVEPSCFARVERTRNS